MKRTSILTSLALTAVALASASSAQASYSPVEQCTSISGTITYTPGLAKRAHAMSAVISGTIAGCSGLNGAQAGTGTFFATVSSPAASIKANNETGTFVINWPVAAGLNPTTGTLGLLGPGVGNTYNLSGQDNAGAYASAVMSAGLVVTGQNPGADGSRRHPIVTQSFVNTLPLQLKVNFG